MNKDFWERIDRLEELAEKTTRPDWDIHVKGDNAYATNIDFLQADNLRYIAAANPAMIFEMIAVFKGRLSYLEHRLTETDIQLGNAQEHMNRLEKEADWLAEKLADSSGSMFDDEMEGLGFECSHECKQIGCTLECRKINWKESARIAVLEADNA